MIKAGSKHEFNSAMIGILLGTGNMVTENRLYLTGDIKQLSYISEKVNYLSNYITPKSIKFYNNKIYVYYNTKKLRYLYKQIYTNFNKHSINRINKISLAFMYMDIGCLILKRKKDKKISSREIHLNTKNFTLQNIKLLQAYINKKFDINFHITMDKNKPRMWCNTTNTKKFIDLIIDIIREFKTMQHKIDLKYSFYCN